jgi:hypothetical protein
MDGTPVTRQFFNQQLTYSLKWAGLHNDRYKGHSFRIGAATTAAAMDTPEDTIKRMGRWHSDAFRKYIRIPALSVEHQLINSVFNNGFMRLWLVDTMITEVTYL